MTTTGGVEASTAADEGAHSLWLDDLGHTLRVERFRGREALSRPFRFDVTVRTARRIPLTAQTLLGRPATLTIRGRDGATRRIRGVVSAQRLLPARDDGDEQRYRIRVEPRFALTRERVQSRIFQDRTVLEIVAAVLNRSRVVVRARTTAKYPPLEYCVQHRESDFDFVSRLLAEHGIWYRFELAAPVEPPPDADAGATRADMVGYTLDGLRALVPGGAGSSDEASEELVLYDGAQGYAALPGATGATGGRARVLRYGRARDAALPAGADVSEFGFRTRVRATQVVQRGFDFANPLALVEHGARTDDPRAPEARDLVERLGLEVFLHRDEYQHPNPERRGARVELERARVDAAVAEAASVACELAPGLRFELDEHPLQELNAGYVVVALEHEGHAPEFVANRARPGAVYANRFRALVASREFRPGVTARRPTQVLETATVVGPPGEVVHTDALGRVRVRFHWDRGGASRDDSSCWIRVAHAQASADFGAAHVPRVGAEVVVGFLDGDLDRPVVLGSLFNGANAPPLDLPAERTRTGLRTRSIGGEGHSELLFEDRAGAELVSVRAQRDLEVEVLRERRARVGAGDVTEVQGGRRADVAGADEARVRGDARLEVGGERVVDVRGGERHEVRGPRALHVFADARTTVEGEAHATVRGATGEITLEGDARLDVRGDATARVGTADAPRGFALYVDDRGEVLARHSLALSAEAVVELRVGRSALRITDARIELVSPEVLVAGEGARLRLAERTARLQADDAAQTVAERVLARSTRGASLGLSTEAALDGARVLLRSPTQARDPVEDRTAPPSVIELRDQDGLPVPWARYVVRLADGTERAGLLDRDGRAALELDADAEVEFPEHSSVRGA